MLYIHIFNTAFSFCLQYQNWLTESWKECSPSPFRVLFLFSLFINEWCKNQSLVFFEEKKQYSLKSKEDWRISFEWGTEFITSLLILVRLVSLWALYTLKWTLVLVGHYLTYESLRHNQLSFTYKDRLSDGHRSFLPPSLLPPSLLPSLPPHTPAKVNWWLGL